MAINQVVKVTVEALTKFGYKANGKFVNYSKNLPEADKARVVPGAMFEAEYYIADSGKEYLNKIVAVAPTQPKAAPVTDINPPVDQERARKFTPKFTKKADDSMSKEEWAAKDQRISRQGVIQAAVIALAPVVSLEQLPEEAVKLATEMLKFVNPS